jgi:sugar-specific transcriptional regulator TrmB
MDIKSYLKQLNLTENEIAVYLALLELGESKIIPITKKVALPRTTVYHILEKLRDKKLIEIIQTTTRRIYAPYPPRNILTLLKHKRAKIDEEIDTLERSLPELNRLYEISPFQPKVRFFPGKEIRQIYDEILEAGVDESWYVGETNKIVKALGEKYLQRWIKRRVKMGIRSKSIRVGKEESQEPIFSGKKEFLREIKYAPEDFKCPTHILIYGDNVAIITTGEENFGVVITSREFAESMRNWFKQLWKISK